MPYQPSIHGPHRVVGPGFQAKVYELVKAVPKGSVVTYGDIASALGLKSVARHVGFALAALAPSRDDVPWHRIVNGLGCVSPRKDDPRASDQRSRLRKEGIHTDARGRIVDFERLRLIGNQFRVARGRKVDRHARSTR